MIIMMTLDKFKNLNDDDVAKLIIKYGSNTLEPRNFHEWHRDNTYEVMSDLPTEACQLNKQAGLDLINFNTSNWNEISCIYPEGEFIDKINITRNDRINLLYYFQSMQSLLLYYKYSSAKMTYAVYCKLQNLYNKLMIIYSHETITSTAQVEAITDIDKLFNYFNHWKKKYDDTGRV